MHTWRDIAATYVFPDGPALTAARISSRTTKTSVVAAGHSGSGDRVVAQAARRRFAEAVHERDVVFDAARARGVGLGDERAIAFARREAAIAE